MTDTTLTHLAFVLDRSGSMGTSGKADEAEKGARVLLADQNALPGRVEVTVARFDDHYELLAVSKPGTEIDDELQIEPRGMTALWDAVGSTIVALGKDLAARDEVHRPGRVVFIVATDGLENASSEYTAAQVKTLIEEQTDRYGWEFMFMGTSQAAVLQAVAAGFSADTSYASSDSAQGVSSSYRVASQSLSSARVAGTRTVVTKDDRKKLS